MAEIKRRASKRRAMDKGNVHTLTRTGTHDHTSITHVEAESRLSSALFLSCMNLSLRNSGWKHTNLKVEFLYESRSRLTCVKVKTYKYTA
jgi:hypothetical protein